jgi:hypothetical protein
MRELRCPINNETICATTSAGTKESPVGAKRAEMAVNPNRGRILCAVPSFLPTLDARRVRIAGNPA